VPRVLKDVASFKADRAWGALDIAEIDGASVRIHWTEKPYRWHVNDGAEVFTVLSGDVDMKYRIEGEVRVAHLSAGDIFIADIGDEHVAEPIGEARILVIERKGSV